jgi:hypothetical protein
MKPHVFIAASIAALVPIQAYATGSPKTIQFQMISANTCVPKATGTVTDHTFGEFENLEVVVQGLPPNTAFDLFAIEVPTAPFGFAWYIGDIDTDANGTGVGNFVGRFNKETFVFSNGVPKTPPPNVFPSPPAVVPEAKVGVKVDAFQLYHLGLWFNSEDDAEKAGCPGTHTPFNGEHNAGIQVLNTANPKNPDALGPLFNLK